MAIIALFFIKRKLKPVIVDIPKYNHPSPTPQTSTTTQSLNPSIFKSLNLPVPFTPQAPTSNWDQLHNEACEEAAAIMNAAYYNNNDNLEPSFVEGEIGKLTRWQDQNFGYNLDTTSAETARMITEVYGLRAKLLDNFTADDIKKELAQNHLIIISENGRLLNNPYYKRPGPIHHMLVIKGYDADNFITNDSGTKNGRNYIYTFDTIHAAAADWDHQNNTVDSNKKIAIIVSKK